LARKHNDAIEPANGSLTNGFEKLSFTDRPSIFSCRMKLFDQWFAEWTAEQKQQMLERMRNIDGDFVSKLELAISSGQLPSSTLISASYEISDELYDQL